MSPSATASASLRASHPWLAVIAVGLATFSVVTTEMLPIGLLTPVADTLASTTGTAGLMISLPALLAALFAPLVVLAAGALDRRRILCGLLALLSLANLASALAPDMAWMLAARVLVGFCMGGIWAVAGGLAARLVPAAAIGMATAIIFGGVAAASVLGVPLGALLGELAGWRWAFGGMAAFSVLVLLCLLAVMPPLPVARSASLHQFRIQLGNRRLLLGLLLTMLLVAGHFMAFTFVRPLLTSRAAFEPSWISGLLFAYGLAGIAGNFLAGLRAARLTVPTLASIALGLLLVPLLLLFFGNSRWGATATLLLWGLAYGGVSVSLMTWMMQAAPRAVEIATALYVGVFNIGIALGSWTGGQLVDRTGLNALLWLSGGCAGSALLLCLAVRKKNRMDHGSMRF